MVLYIFALKRPLEEHSKRKMQMTMINMASVSRKKSLNKSTNNEIFPLKSPQVLNKIEDFNNIVVMSGTATRKHNDKKEKCFSGIQILGKNNFKKSFFKLRAPPYKSHQKQVHPDEKLMTKSCEVLFDCIKPYKEIRVAKKSHVTEVESFGSVFKTNTVVYERKATRKIQFFTFFEENPSKCFLWDEHQISVDSLRTGCIDFNMDNLEVQNETTAANEEKEKPDQRKTVSSEDFITNVFSEAGSI